MRLSWRADGGPFSFGGGPAEFWMVANWEGDGDLRYGGQSLAKIGPLSVVLGILEGRWELLRHGKKPHRYVCVEASGQWLRQWVGPAIELWPREIQASNLPEGVLKTMEEIAVAPVGGAFESGWYQAKALEMAACILAPAKEEFFCEHQKRLARERVEKVKAILARDLEHPPTLKQLAGEAGCSPHYLSRIFSQETGTTISRYLRDLRLDRAAEILKAGRSNVTEAAMEVGYSSLSHFSKAFSVRFGVCPCVFPLNGAPIQKLRERGKAGSG